MNQIFSDIVLIFIFVIVNGFFAASEIAIVTVRQSRIKQLVEEGSQRAVSLLKLREDPNRFLATIQIGVTMAGAIASAIGGAVAVEIIKPELQKIPLISPYAEAIALALVVLVITYISLIFGELIPKSLAMAYSESIALFTSPIVERLAKFGSLPVKLLTQSTNILLKPFGKKSYSERGFISEEEVKLLLEEGGQQGVFQEQEKELIHSVFEFKDTFVKEVMSPATQMVTIGINMTSETVKNIILEEKFSRYPVVGRDLNDIRGILYAKDFFNLISKSNDASIHKLIKPPYFVPETMKISNLLKEMQKKRMHMAIVIDEYGAVTGLVTLEDLLEEIVGEIRDEYDTDSPVIKLPDGSMIIDASISIDDLRDDYSIHIPESPDYETLSGFILTQLQRIPQTGDFITEQNMKLKIIEMLGQRISKVKLEFIEDKSEPQSTPVSETKQ